MVATEIHHFINKSMDKSIEEKVYAEFENFSKNWKDYLNIQEKTIFSYIAEKFNLKYVDSAISILKKKCRQQGQSISDFYPTDAEELIIKDYLNQKCSVSKVLKKFGVWGRRYITNLLKKRGVHSSVNPESKKILYEHSYKQAEKTCFKKYGVKNIGETKQYGYCASNKIPYKKPTFFNSLMRFHEKVHALTKNNLKKITPPEYCEYTGIKFADTYGPCNPNDPTKRSVDHKMPRNVAFFAGWSPEKTASTENLVFCLKYCNTVKSNTIHKDFIPIAQHLRKYFINEGYEHN